jgi:hypothetical protein
MFDATIHFKTIARRIESSDFSRDPMLYNPNHLKMVVEKAVGIGQNGFSALPLKASLLRGKSVYQLTEVHDLLIARHLTANIRQITGVKQDDRTFIVKCIRSLMAEGPSFRVYKFDIKSFYESVDARKIINYLSTDVAFSGQSVRALDSLFNQLTIQGISGLPRGMSISATLAEYLLRSFDRKISNQNGVWYYARFVDDMLLITSGLEVSAEFKSAMAAVLPPGLEFNTKSALFTFDGFTKGVAQGTEHAFNFLGYEFSVSRAFRAPGGIRRTVDIDISPAKVNKIKTRLTKAALQFRIDGNYTDLRDRIRLLSGNYTFIDKKKDIRRCAGVYFSYPLVEPSSSEGLRSLDKYLRRLVTSPHPKSLLRPLLTPGQRSELAGLTFTTGFTSRRFFSFSSTRLAALTKCWSYA